MKLNPPTLEYFYRCDYKKNPNKQSNMSQRGLFFKANEQEKEPLQHTTVLVSLCFTFLNLIDALHPACSSSHPPLCSVFQDRNTSSGFGLPKLDKCSGGKGSHFINEWS